MIIILTVINAFIIYRQNQQKKQRQDRNDILLLLLFFLSTDSRSIGNEVKLRRHKDSRPNVLLIPDPTQTILSDGAVIQAWQIYAQIVSIEHSVYLQVWHPVGSTSAAPSASVPGLATEDTYVLVGQTFIQPTELRFHERALPAEDFLRTSRGDVLGLYFPQFNPIGWSSVPCGSPRQSCLYVESPTNVTIGRTLTFKSTSRSRNSCRIYSIQALFGKRIAGHFSRKLFRDWKKRRISISLCFFSPRYHCYFFLSRSVNTDRYQIVDIFISVCLCVYICTGSV